MSLYTDDQLREWLEDMLRFNGRDADRAKGLLEIMDGVRDLEDELTAWGEAGAGDPAETKKQLETAYCLIETIDEQDYRGWVGDTPDQKLEKAIETYEADIAALYDIRALCMDAGLLKPGDATTPLVPLLAMFLPVD